MKISNKKELRQITLKNSADMEFKGFLKLYKDHTKEPFLFCVKDTTLSSDNPL